MLYRAICRIVQKGNRNDFIHLDDFEGKSAREVVRKVINVYGNDRNFVVGYLYAETDSDYEPIGYIVLDPDSQQLYDRPFRKKGDSAYLAAVNNYEHWEDLRGYGN